MTVLKKKKAAEGEHPLRLSLWAAQLGGQFGLRGLSDDLRGLRHDAHRERREHGASGDQGVKLGHGMIFRNWVGTGCDRADQATICAAWFSVAKAIGANTAQAAIRA